MRHGMRKTKLGRNHNHQKALRRNLAYALLTEGKIKTTLAKAKLVQPVVEKLITMAKDGNAAADADKQRFIRNLTSFFTGGQNKRVFAKVTDKQAKARRKEADKGEGKKASIEQPRLVKKLLTEIAPAYATRNGGYTRIYRLPTRLGDNAEMSILALV